VYVMAGGERYEGETWANQRNGYGIHTWPNGDRYEGMLKDGTMDGPGARFLAGGAVQQGLWRGNKLVKALAPAL
jgi:hypothetical protein